MDKNPTPTLPIGSTPMERAPHPRSTPPPNAAMPLVETKTQLIAKLHESRAALEKVVAKVPPEAMAQPGLVEEWSAKDVLAHWQELHLGWWAAVQRGETPDYSNANYTNRRMARIPKKVLA